VWVREVKGKQAWLPGWAAELGSGDWRPGRARRRRRGGGHGVRSATSGSNLAARVEAQRLLALVPLLAGAQRSGEPAGAGPALPTRRACRLCRSSLICTSSSWPGTPGRVVEWVKSHRPADSRQGDSGSSPEERSTSLEFGATRGVLHPRELVVDAARRSGGVVAVRVDSQGASLPNPPGARCGPGAVRVVESRALLGSVGFELRCDPAGGTVPDPADLRRDPRQPGAAVQLPEPRSLLFRRCSGEIDHRHLEPQTGVLEVLGMRGWTRATGGRLGSPARQGRAPQETGSTALATGAREPGRERARGHRSHSAATSTADRGLIAPRSISRINCPLARTWRQHGSLLRVARRPRPGRLASRRPSSWQFLHPRALAGESLLIRLGAALRDKAQRDHRRAGGGSADRPSGRGVVGGVPFRRLLST
jgi:hypothetical protein